MIYAESVKVLDKLYQGLLIFYPDQDQVRYTFDPILTGQMQRCMIGLYCLVF